MIKHRNVKNDDDGDDDDDNNYSDDDDANKKETNYLYLQMTQFSTIEA